MGSAGVTSGSWYAACQSAAMGGGALLGLPAIAAIGATVGVTAGVGIMGVKYCRRARNKVDPNAEEVKGEEVEKEEELRSPEEPGVNNVNPNTRLKD